MFKGIFLISVVILFIFNNAFADDSIFTTYRDDGNSIVFDGKWTFEQEWKHASEDIIKFSDGNQFSIKTAHDRKNLYVLIDFFTSKKITKDSDYGMFCITSNSTKQDYAQNDDYCFRLTIGSKTAIVLQGGSALASTNHYKKIQPIIPVTVAGGISDSNDRYNSVPHPIYEFKIPIELVGRSDDYGFYVSAFEAHTNHLYSWPNQVTNGEFSDPPSPSMWGHLVSPDKSLPEFEFSLPVLLFSIIIMIYLTRRRIFNHR